jgi:hypothetical protein
MYNVFVRIIIGPKTAGGRWAVGGGRWAEGGGVWVPRGLRGAREGRRQLCQERRHPSVIPALWARACVGLYIHTGGQRPSQRQRCRADEASYGH